MQQQIESRQEMPKQQMPVNNDAPMPPKKAPKKGMDLSKVTSLFVLFGVSLLALALIVILVFGTSDDKTRVEKVLTQEASLINTDRYQAVFLDSQDGQVYFGKLVVLSEDLYQLTDIYYVRVEQALQPQTEGQQSANISLAKLGNELHGPEDAMYIARDKVLYWENLKDDGQVVTAITNFKANGGESSGDTTSTQPVGTPQQDDTAGDAAAEAPAAEPATENTTN